MRFVHAGEEDADEILRLYRSLLDCEGCVWDVNYPSRKEIDFDLSRNSLFCLRDQNGTLAGVVSIDDDPEVERLACWSKELRPVAEVSRLGVSKEYQNQKIAARLLESAMEELRKRGYRAVHYLVCKEHIRARHAYERLEFRLVGETVLMGHNYLCYEKAL